MNHSCHLLWKMQSRDRKPSGRHSIINDKEIVKRVMSSPQKTEICKKSWRDGARIVRDIRNQFSGSSLQIPSAMLFRETSNEDYLRIYFLAPSSSGPEVTIFYVDLPLTSQQSSARLKWNALIDPNFQSIGKLSKEELMIWERKRLMCLGITSYEFHMTSGTCIFTIAGGLYQCIDSPSKAHPIKPSVITPTYCNGTIINPQICPYNPHILAYVNNGDIWVSCITSGCNVRLTYARHGHKQLSQDPKFAGIPSYVTQEEFNRYDGFWWKNSSNDGQFAIVYEEVDESDVAIFHVPLSESEESNEIEQYRFPRAGTKNAKSTLKMVEFSVSSENLIEGIVYFELKYSLSLLFPWMEYIMSVGWTGGNHNLWIVILDRLQQRLELIMISLKSFIPIQPTTEQNILCDSLSIKVLLRCDSSFWHNPHELIYFFPCSRERKISFLWLGRQTGYNHLYFTTVSTEDNTSNCQLPGVSLTPHIIEEKALTNGEWEVLARELWVDLEYRLVYFMCLLESPLEKQLYAVSLDKPKVVRSVTASGFSHSISMNKDCDYFVTSFSNVNTPVSSKIFRIVHHNSTVEGIEPQEVGIILEPTAVKNASHCPKLFECKISSGDTLFSMILQPHNYIPGRKYPTLLNIYGGPEIQLVTNAFKGIRLLRSYMLAASGFCVVSIDSRGSANRGMAFEAHIKGKLGCVELIDQIEVLNWLAERTGMIDMTRVAVHGWSYGGYLSLVALAKHSDIFKVAIAGAPVTSWELYDTGYTERYLGLPQDNALDYTNGSVFTFIDQFPNEENRLLIIHGLLDENVHFCHTSQLIAALVKAGKPHQLQVYPNERHSLRQIESSEHYETLLLTFLLNHV